MKGYYAIYSHSQDGWWTDGGYWYKQKQYITKSIPMGYTISVGSSVGGASATATNYEKVVTDDSSAEFTPIYIKKFDTLNLSLIHISSPRDRTRSRMPSSA